MSILGDGILVNFAKLDKLYKRVCFEAVAEYQFTPSEILVLMFLANNAPLDTAKDIVQYRGVSKSLVAKSVESLCEQGFLRLERDRQDRRLVHLRLTGQSAPVVARLRECKRAFAERLERGIPEQSLREMERGFALLEQNLNRMLKGTEET